MAEPLRIVPVEGPRDFERFVRLPDDLYAGDPNWRAPLLMERREALSPRHNPFFQHAEVQFWLARRGERDVGRISAQVERLAPPRADGAPTGYFGCLAAEDDREVVGGLTGAAETWLAARGVTQALGPFSLGINEEMGVLVDGFDTPPMLMMPHDPPWLGARLEEAGYAKAKDAYAFLAGDLDPPIADRLLEAVGAIKGVAIREVDMRRLDAEVMRMVAIFNTAWAGNWGFVPLTEAETHHLAKSLKLVLDPRLMCFLQIDGRDVGFGVCLPDLNEAARGLRGRLFPFGWATLLWRLKRRKVKGCRLLLMGVEPGVGVGVTRAGAPFLIVDRLRREAIKLGYERVEISWVLEDNRPAVRMAQGLGARRYKTYRIYGKALA